MTTVGRPTKSNIFRRIRYAKNKGKRKAIYTYERLTTTAVDVDMDNAHEMVSHSL